MRAPARSIHSSASTKQENGRGAEETPSASPGRGGRGFPARLAAAMTPTAFPTQAVLLPGTLTFRSTVVGGRGGRDCGRRRRCRRHRGGLVGYGRRGVGFGVGVRVGVPARRASSGTRRRELQDGPAAGYRPRLLPHREPERELRASTVERGGHGATRYVMNIYEPAAPPPACCLFKLAESAHAHASALGLACLEAPPPLRKGGLAPDVLGYWLF